MRFAIACVASSLLFSMTTVALARPAPLPRPITLSTDILEVVTTTRAQERTRVILATTAADTPTIQLDALTRTRRGWVVTASARFDRFFVDNTPLDTRGLQASNVVIRRNVVAFDLLGPEPFQCRLRLRDDGDRRPNQVHCAPDFGDDDAWEPRPPMRPAPPRPSTRPDHDHDHDHVAPPPPRPQWAADPNVIQSCASAFIGSSAQQRCRDLVRDFAIDPVPSIRACQNAVIGSDAGLQCLAYAGGYAFEPSSAIRACQDALIGSSAILKCIDLSSSARVNPEPAIRACKNGSIGSSAILSCIQSAFR